ncbi:PAS domain S-box protein [Methylibium sp.]|uniref:PAS domain S-box protein n=1 Tax=Methylibium sp. TaxID=2067992 RepID=UPI003D0A0D06
MSAADAVVLWHGFLDTLTDPLLMLDGQGRVRFANTPALRLYPFEPGMPLEDLPPVVDAGLVSWVQDVLEGRADELLSSFPDAALSQLSAQRWALRLPAPGRRERGPNAMQAGVQPLAEVRQLYWNSPFPATLEDENYRIVDVNQAFVDYTGWSRSRLVGMDALALVPLEDHALWESTRQQLPADHDGSELPALVERRLIDVQGRDRWYRGAQRHVADADGRVLRLSVMQDCTAEHAARERAERSLSELDQWFELSPVGMLAFDGAGLVLRSNAVFETLVGRVPVLLSEAPQSLNDLLGWHGPRSLAELLPGGEAAERRGWVAALPGARSRSPRHLRARVRCTDAVSGSEPRYIAVIEDLSVEQALDLAQAQLGALVDAAGVGVALDSVGRDLVLPDSLPEFERLQRALRGGEAAQARYAIRHPELGMRWLLTRVAARPQGGGEASVVTLDVTEQERSRTRSEELLRELSSILESSSAGIAYLRGNTLVRCNRSFERMLGMSAGAVAGCSVRELFAGQPQARLVAEDAELALLESGVYETEIEIVLPQRGPHWVSLAARRIGAPGPGAEVVAVLSDITRLKRQQAQLERLADERERTESAMTQQAELTRAILDSVFVGIVTVGLGGIEWMNRSARRMFGGDLADFQHQPLSCVATADPQHPFRHALTQLEAPGLRSEIPSSSFECRVQARDGRAFWVVGNVVSTGEAEQPQLTYALLDIDRRRRAEARSAQAQASLQRVIDLAPLAIALFDAATGELRQVNPLAAAVAGQPGEALVGRRPEELQLLVDGQSIRADLQAALEAGDRGEVTLREYRFEREGREQVWEARFLPLGQPGEPPDEVLLVAVDVTEQRAAQAARLEAAIAQRDMLVKEVHHRIKNNLQGVAGLLAQIAQRQPEVAPAIHEAAAQVQAIAQVYGLQVGSQGPVQLASLVSAIAASLQRGSGRTIVVSLPAHDAPSWALPEAEAIPIALTLNELLGNALKHGSGTVECSLVSQVEEARIEVRNEGRLPEGFSLDRVAAGVYGLGLVRALLPRRSASFSLAAEASGVLACVSLRPPGLARLDTLSARVGAPS